MLKPKSASFKASKAKLARARRNLRSYLLRESQTISNLMQRYARLMSPRQSMSLENSIIGEYVKNGNIFSIKLYVNKNYSVTRRPGFTVGRYAEIMHNDTYKLGKISEMKNKVVSAKGIHVGNQFLNRAGHLVWNRKKEAMRQEAKRIMGW